MEFSFPGDYWFEVVYLFLPPWETRTDRGCGKSYLPFEFERPHPTVNKGKGKLVWWWERVTSHDREIGQTCKREGWNHESHQTYLSRTFLMQVGCISHQLWDPPESTEIILVLVPRAAHKGNVMPCHAMQRKRHSLQWDNSMQVRLRNIEETKDTVCHFICPKEEVQD